MDAFLKEWYGILTFILFDLLALTVIISITYRWFFKRILDFITATLGLILLSPLFFVLYLYANNAKKHGKIENKIIKETYVGKKGKTIVLRSFNLGKIGKILWLFDLLCGKISFVGTMLLRPQDATFLDEDEKEREGVRPGLIHPLILCGNENTDYDEALQVEKRYANNFSFFKDLQIFFAWLLKKIRIEGKEYLGETQNFGYAEALLRDERITKQDYDAALEVTKMNI